VARFLLRAHDENVELKAQRLLATLHVEDIRIIRDETVAEAWLDDLDAGRTIHGGLAEIEQYLRRVAKAPT